MHDCSRRAFVTGGVAFVVMPGPVAAQPGVRLPRVGFLTPNGANAPTTRQNLNAFFERLRELGWIDGGNFVSESRYAEWKYERLPSLAMDLVRIPVDVIFANSAPAAAAAKRATTSIPIVFETLGDPVSVGLVGSLARPGGNLTGVSGLSPELSGKRLELLKEALPGLRRVIVLANPGNAMTPPTVRETERAASVLGVKVEVVEAANPTDLDGALARIRGDAGTGAVIVPDSMLLSQAARVQATLVKQRVPAIHNETGWEQAGALMLFGSSLRDHFAQAATLIDKILRGARPSDLPVQQSTKFELVVNLKTAKALGITIPPVLLLRADRVVE